jgi:hypothetical protein
MLSQGSDVHERWSHESCIATRDLILRLLHTHATQNPTQTILLLGGDVHTGAAYRVDFQDGPRLFQLVSSAISNREQPIMSTVSEAASRAVRVVDADRLPNGEVRLLPGMDNGRSKNPFGGLNLGLVDVIDQGHHVAIRQRLISYDEADGSPRAVFDSGVLAHTD